MVSSSNAKLKFTAYLLIVIHLVFVVLHAAAHQTLEVNPTTLQLSFIVIVIIAAPVTAGVVLWKYEKAGSILLTLSMFGGLVFGVYNHFVGHSIDHVAEVAHMQPEVWATIFQLTAVGLAISEIISILIGILLVAFVQPRLETHAA